MSLSLIHICMPVLTRKRVSDIGFRHIIDGGHVSNFRNAADAEAASNAVHVLEHHMPPIEGIDEGDSQYLSLIHI